MKTECKKILDVNGNYVKNTVHIFISSAFLHNFYVSCYFFSKFTFFFQKHLIASLSVSSWCYISCKTQQLIKFIHNLYNNKYNV